MVITDGSKGTGGGRMHERMNEIAGSVHGSVRGGENGHGDVSGKPYQGVSRAFGRRLACPYLVAAVVAERRANVPTFNGVGGPRCADRRLLMDHNASAGGCKRGAVEVERTMELGVGREAGVQP
jgi:hypothetical protein